MAKETYYMAKERPHRRRRPGAVIAGAARAVAVWTTALSACSRPLARHQQAPLRPPPCRPASIFRALCPGAAWLAACPDATSLGQCKVSSKVTHLLPLLLHARMPRIYACMYVSVCICGMAACPDATNHIAGLASTQRRGPSHTAAARPLLRSAWPRPQARQNQSPGWRWPPCRPAQDAPHTAPTACAARTRRCCP